MHKARTIAAALAIGIASLSVISTASAKESTKSTKFDKPSKCVKLSKKGNKMHCKKSKIKVKSVVGKSGANGTNGVNGAPGVNGKDGIAGPAGKDGLNGVSGYEVMTWDYDNVGPGGIATVACSSQSKVAISGGFHTRNGVTDMSGNMPALSNGSGIVSSFPGRMDWTTNTPKPGRLDGWIMRFNDKPAGAVTLYVVCITAA